MAVELRVPAVGESITQVEVGDWLQPPGELVRQDDPVVMLETDKVTVDLPAPVSGVVSQMLKNKGEHAEVGEVIGYMEPREVSGAGDDGRRQEAPGAEATRAMPAAPRVLEAAPATEQRPPAAHGARQEEVVPMTPLRRRIAERLVQAQQAAALLTTFNEVDMTEVIALRRSYKERFAEKYHTKLGIMSFFVKAAVEALKTFPAVNAEIRGDNVAYRNYFDIGVAVGGGKGLVVPVLRNAERMSFGEIERDIADFAERAAKSALKLQELEGGTFTISNGGVYGSLLSTPIINPPQSGILGLHAVQERAVVQVGQIVARSMMYVALTYDHRVVDGREAVQFLVRIKDLVETPTRILLEL